MSVMGAADSPRMRGAAVLYGRVHRALESVFPDGRVSTHPWTVVVDCGETSPGGQPPLPPLVETRRRSWLFDGCGDARRREESLASAVELITRNSFEAVPLWVEVGLGQVFRTAELTTDGTTLSVGTPVAAHYTLLRSRSMPVRTMLGASRESKTWTDPVMRQLFTAQAWVHMHWLLCQEKNGREQLTEFLRSVARNDAPDVALRAFADDIDTRDHRIRDYIGRGVFGRWRIESPTTGANAASARTLSAMQTAAWKLEIALDRGGEGGVGPGIESGAPISADLERAVSTEPDGALLLAAIGRLRARDKRHRDAVDLFERAIATRTITPNDRAWIELSYASILLADATSDRASAIPRADLERAEALLGSNELTASGNADALALLATAHLALGNHGAAVQHAALAFQSHPRHEYALLLARAWLEAGRGAAARQILEPLVERGRTADIRQSAKQMLATAPPGDSRIETAVPVFRQLAAGEVRFVGRLLGFVCSPTWVVVEVETSSGIRRAAITRLDLLTFVSHQTAPIDTLRCGKRANAEPVHLIARPHTNQAPVANGTQALALPEGVTMHAVAVEFVPERLTVEPRQRR